MSDSISLLVNGRSVNVTSDPERPLLDVLREDLGLTGTKYGCGEGHCGSCTVLIDDDPVHACRLPVGRAVGRKLVTIEGLAPAAASADAGGKLHPVQEAFLAEAGFQCGYCTPGMIMTTVALLREIPEPTDEEIVDRLNGNICRCCGYPRILSAVRRAAARMKR